MHEKTGNRTQKSRGSPENSPRRGDIQWNSDANRLRSETSRPTSSVANGTLKPGGLIKKVRHSNVNLFESETGNSIIPQTVTVTIDDTDLHLISYYTQEDIVHNRLKRLVTRPDIANLILEPQIFRLGSFRCPPKVISGPDGKLMIAYVQAVHNMQMPSKFNLISSSPEAEEAEPQETVADGSPHRSPEHHLQVTSVVASSSSRSIQTPHQDRNAFHPEYTPSWRGEYESAHTMADQYRQDTRWVTSGQTHSINGYSGPDAQVHTHRGGEQDWRGSPELQYPEMYAQSSLDTTVNKQRDVAEPSDGVYDRTTLYVDQSPGQRTHAPTRSPQIQPIGSAYLLGWPTSAQRHEYSPTDTGALSTTVRSKPTHPPLTLPSTHEIYSADNQWSASPANEYTVSPLRHEQLGQTYYTYTDSIQDGAGHHYKVDEYENDRYAHDEIPN